MSESLSATTSEPSRISLARTADGILTIALSGDWSLKHGLVSAAPVEREIESAPPQRVAFDAKGLTEWDSTVLTFVRKVLDSCRERGMRADATGLPPGLHRLLDLAEAVPEKEGARAKADRKHFLERVGLSTLANLQATREVLSYLGEATLAFRAFARGKARYRKSDVWLSIQEAGAQAVPIVTLISFLVGVILAFVGAVQLQKFGAQIYVADLVGIAMVRELAAVMTAIIMAGRTGAAYAAQLGTMKVNQEIDAFTTLGFSPMEFLVLPRMIALCSMMPLLSLYADFVGILGGAAIGTGMLGISWTTYFQQTTKAITLTTFFGGIFKASVYGVLVAFSGCLRGLQCGKSASAVGDAATSAVVTGIVLIIIACGLFSVMFYVLGI
jgi:phospholipid/cholesterol/gamma-HCH transport system permease protein